MDVRHPRHGRDARPPAATPPRGFTPKTGSSLCSSSLPTQLVWIGPDNLGVHHATDLFCQLAAGLTLATYSEEDRHWRDLWPLALHLIPFGALIICYGVWIKERSVFLPLAVSGIVLTAGIALANRSRRVPGLWRCLLDPHYPALRPRDVPLGDLPAHSRRLRLRRPSISTARFPASASVVGSSSRAPSSGRSIP